jgi:hypothetical protein
MKKLRGTTNSTNIRIYRTAQKDLERTCLLFEAQISSK